jgi:hypothetical protein
VLSVFGRLSVAVIAYCSEPTVTNRDRQQSELSQISWTPNKEGILGTSTSASVALDKSGRLTL